MALTLGDLINAARDRSPWFTRQNVPHAVVARYLTGLQRRYLSKIAEVNAEAYAQQASVVFAVSPENAVGVVAAGSAGGLPASLVAGAPVGVELPAGSAVEMDFDNAQILYPQTVVAQAANFNVGVGGAPWVVNAYAGKYVHITDGPGIGQRRQIISNTNNLLIIAASDGRDWATTPVPGASVFEIVNPVPEISEGVGVVTALPADTTRVGYLVRLNALGVPYIDLTKPLVATFGVGIDLPPMEYPIGGAVRFATGEEAAFEFRRYGQRWTLGVSGYGGYILGGKLFLIGATDVWGGVASIDLRYVPIAPALTALTDLLLLDDTAYDSLVARGALLMANRVNGLPDVGKVDATGFVSEAQEAESTFLLGVGRVARTFPKFVQTVW